MDYPALDDIIVTAQKREQNLQDVPIVVTAVSDQLLQDTGVKDIKDLSVLVPGLTVTSSTSEASTTARIRGVGTVGDNPGLESSVGIVIDGVYRPRNGVAFGDLGELDRIEVLKGPQGTLFGKNTSAGVINVVTRKPTRDFTASAEVSAGNYNIMEASGSINGPISDTLAGRLYVVNRQRDGFVDVSTGAGPRTSDEDANRHTSSARGQLLFSASDNFSARVTVDYATRDERCCGAVQMNVGPTAANVAALAQDGGVAIPADIEARQAFANRNHDQQITDEGVALELSWNLEKLQLKSISAAREWRIENGQDLDYSSADLLYRKSNGDNFTEFGQVTQELQLNGATERMNWVIGAFYARERLDNASQVVFGNDFETYVSSRFAPSIVTGDARATWLATQLGLAPGSVFAAGEGQIDKYAQRSTSAALFANDSIALTDALELTLGARYTQEEKELTSRYDNTAGGLGCDAIRQNLTASPMASSSIASQLLLFPQSPAEINSLPIFVGTGCSTAADPAFNDLLSHQDSVDEDQWSGTAKLAWRLNDQLMTYTSYARGYKAGGYQLDRSRMSPVTSSAVLDTSFDPELVDSYELGLKSNLVKNTLLLNATAFYQDFSDFQLNTFTGVQFVVRSIPQVVSKGIDADLIWQTPWPQLNLQGGVTYAKTQIEDFGSLLNEAGVFSATRKSDQLSFAPEWSGTLSATFEQRVGSRLVLRANLGAKYLSSYNTGSNLDPMKIQDAYTLVNARLAIASINDAWTLEAWAQNLTDKTYAQVIIDGPAQTATYDAFLGAPRTFGITGRVRF
jgi:outer membrane receptor protein involved in Fe transport